MTSDLVQETRRVWFCGEDGLIVKHPARGEVVIRRKDIAAFGGPRVDLTCEPCAVMDWLSRIDGQSRFAPHTCSDPTRTANVQRLCQRIESDEWCAARKDYNFTLGVDPDLPGLRGLILAKAVRGFVSPGDDKAMIGMRQRYSPFQLDVADSLPTDLEKYDFLIALCGRDTDGVQHAMGRTRVFVYAHDHHGRKSDTDPKYQRTLDLGPDVLLTPYPHIWTSAYRIPRRTNVIFMPHLSSTFFARPITDFNAKRYDVMVVGVAGQWAYPQRHRLARTMKKAMQQPGRAGRWVLDTCSEHARVSSECSSLAAGGRKLHAWDVFLAQSRIVAFGQDRWGYLVMKYAEIPANCSLMVCPDIPDLKLLGLESGTHFVPLAEPVETSFVAQMTNILANWDLYEPIARAGFEWHRTRADDILFDQFRRDIVSVVQGE
jgi:hypothetical protein